MRGDSGRQLSLTVPGLRNPRPRCSSSLTKVIFSSCQEDKDERRGRRRKRKGGDSRRKGKRKSRKERSRKKRREEEAEVEDNITERVAARELS